MDDKYFPSHEEIARQMRRVIEGIPEAQVLHWMEHKDPWFYLEVERTLTPMNGHLRFMWNYPLSSECTGDIETCQEQQGECLTCSVRDCPYQDPMHYHHDGCPCCGGAYEPEDLDPLYTWEQLFLVVQWSERVQEHGVVVTSDLQGDLYGAEMAALAIVKMAGIAWSEEYVLHRAAAYLRERLL